MIRLFARTGEKVQLLSRIAPKKVHVDINAINDTMFSFNLKTQLKRLRVLSFATKNTKSAKIPGNGQMWILLQDKHTGGNVGVAGKCITLPHYMAMFLRPANQSFQK